MSQSGRDWIGPGGHGPAQGGKLLLGVSCHWDCPVLFSQPRLAPRLSIHGSEPLYEGDVTHGRGSKLPVSRSYLTRFLERL